MRFEKGLPKWITGRSQCIKSIRRNDKRRDGTSAKTGKALHNDTCSDAGVVVIGQCCGAAWITGSQGPVNYDMLKESRW